MISFRLGMKLRQRSVVLLSEKVIRIRFPINFFSVNILIVGIIIIFTSAKAGTRLSKTHNFLLYGLLVRLCFGKGMSLHKIHFCFYFVTIPIKFAQQSKIKMIVC